MTGRLKIVAVVGALGALLPSLASAAEEATDLVVVADTRVLKGFSLYLANLYNENVWMFAIWAVVLTALLGGFLGLTMDAIMSRVGLNLSEGGGHVEH
ncbi:MAG: DVU0150 family protein [Candidatus Binatia bacterium]|jgi:hypothetical protein